MEPAAGRAERAGRATAVHLIVAGFLVVYVVIGPMLYIVLRRTDRREAAWALVPAITLVFTFAAYGANFLIRGTGVSLRTLEVAETFDDGGATQVRTYAALFSPGRREYDVSMPTQYQPMGKLSTDDFGGNPNAAAPSTGRPVYRVESGRNTVLRGLSADVYSFTTWKTSHVESSPQTALSAEITGNGTTLDGAVVNRSSGPIEDVVVINNGAVGRLGALQPGQSQAIGKMEPFDGMWQDASSGAGRQRMELVRTFLYPSSGATASGENIQGLDADEVLIIGWQKLSEQPMRVLGADVGVNAERMVVAHTSYTLRSGVVNIALLPQNVQYNDSDRSVTMRFRAPTDVTITGAAITVPAPEQQGGGGWEAVPGAPGAPVPVFDGLPQFDPETMISKLEMQQATPMTGWTSHATWRCR
ncbi:MAG: hypothetical protein WKH64_14685 [Chloroflexia bacterium]